MIRPFQLWLCLVLSSCAATPQNSFHLKPSDTVVFYGDSITDQRLYTTFVETFVLTRFPQHQVKFVHSGWGGDRVSGGGGGPVDVRLQRDVTAYKPSVITIMLGMNDARYKAFDAELFDTYANGLRAMVKTLRQELPNARITLIQPSPFDDTTRPANFEGGYNAVLLRYGQFVKELAAKEKLFTADLNAPVVQELERAKAADPANAQKLIPDRVHPGPAGHLLMAKALLKAWNAPAVVSSVAIDWGGQVTRSEKTRITDRLQSEHALQWTQTDEALPFPVDTHDPLLALALRSSDLEATLNQQMLQVRGLTGPRYYLSIDGEAMGTFTPEQLRRGVNLALLPTPMAKQAADVHALTLKHNNVHFARWRTVQAPLEKDGFAEIKPTLAALDKLEDEIVTRQRAAAQPKARKFGLALDTH